MPGAAVLVVDDERLIRWSLQQRLEQDGHRVLLADCGAQALARLEADVSVVLLDLMLPDTEDLSLLREIRRRNPECSVILMTAHGGPELSREARSEGALEVLGKPFSLDAVSSLVSRACSRSAVGSPGAPEPAADP